MLAWRHIMMCGFMMFSGPHFAAADPVTVTIKSYSRSNSAIAVVAKIFRKELPLEGSEFLDTDETGSAVFTEEKCSSNILYRAEPAHPSAYPKGGNNWQQCKTTTPIVFAFTPSGLSPKAIAVLEGDLPANWRVPDSYVAAIESMKAAQADEKWGVVAKLGSQLGHQFRSAGLYEQANVFAEIGVAGAAIYAAEKADDPAMFDGTMLVPDAAGKTNVLSDKSKMAIVEIQKACGTAADGVVGWKTMNCLPGGMAYQLPPDILAPIDLNARPRT